jgi:hypothetical protein
VDIEMLPDGSAVAAWIEFADRQSRFLVRRVDATGRRSQSVAIAGDGTHRVSGYPRMARQGDELIFAWTESTTGPEGARLQVRGSGGRLTPPR